MGLSWSGLLKFTEEYESILCRNKSTYGLDRHVNQVQIRDQFICQALFCPTTTTQTGHWLANQLLADASNGRVCGGGMGGVRLGHTHQPWGSGRGSVHKKGFMKHDSNSVSNVYFFTNQWGRVYLIAGTQTFPFEILHILTLRHLKMNIKMQIKHFNFLPLTKNLTEKDIVGDKADGVFMITCTNIPTTGLTTKKNIYIVWCDSSCFVNSLTSRPRGAVVEALNWMDPDLVETPWDSPALQKTPAPKIQANRSPVTMLPSQFIFTFS